MKSPQLSVVIPVYNEQENIETLSQRLIPVLDSTGMSYEVVLVNDGSKDQTETLLDALHTQHPHQFRIIHFNGNFGQHMAIMAGLEHAKGEIVITLDADLQNPPEEIPKLLAAIQQGHDVVGTYRMNRKDSLWRLWISRLHNWVRTKIAPKLNMRDEGSMLRAYRRPVVDLMLQSKETSTFVNALAMNYALNPAEVGVAHEARSAGTSNYNFYKLFRYNFDLITNFSLVPLEVFTFLGTIISFISGLFVVYMFLRRLFIGPEAEGVFTLFSILFFLVSLCLLGLGIIGEYVGRIYQEVRGRPRFVIKRMTE